MAESAREKSEPPTEKRKRDTRKKGQVAKSMDVVSATNLLFVFMFFFIAWPTMFEKIQLFTVESLRIASSIQSHEQMVEYAAVASQTFIRFVLPLLAVAIAAGVIGNVMQFGFLVSGEPLKPSLKKLNPAEGIKRIFSKRAVFGLFMNILKITFLSTLLYIVIKGSLSAITTLSMSEPMAIASLTSTIVFRIVLFALIAFIVFGVIDFAYQKHSHFKKLKMSKDEVKREYKESEGDPIIKGKRKQLAQEIANNKAIEYAKRATVLVTNPTHLAIALYQTEKNQIPFVIAKGEGAVASAMIKAAQEAEVPIMQDVPLAHDLFEEGELMQYIPNNLIRPVAAVLRWVEKEGQRR